MFIERLDHVNIITPRFAETLEFYERVMQMQIAPSPIGEHGAHLRDASGVACIHVVKVTAGNVDFLLGGNLAHRTREETDPSNGFSNMYGSAAVDHIALRCTNLPATLQRFRDTQVPHRYFFVEMARVHQIFVRDPNGVTLELNFFEEVPDEVLANLNRGSIAPAA